MTFSYAVWSLMAPFTMMALGAAPRIAAPDTAPPTAIEQALIERACAGVASTGVAETDPHVQCLGTQLVSLRADFGRDLRRLSVSERSTLDSTCSRLQATRGREAYLDCLAAQLTALRNRRSRASRTVAEEPAVAPAPADVPPAAATTPPRESSARVGLLIAGTLTTIAVVGASVIVVLRKRRVRHTCRNCGTTIESGDLCAACRHEAADALRRAATERLEQVRAEEVERRRKTEHAELRRQQAHLEDEARLREEEEEARQREEAARRRQAEEARRQSAPAGVLSHDTTAGEAFDPYTVLGVPRDTSREDIRAAYEEARSKYDQDRVAHLGVDVQEHFKAKAEAIDRAYQMLAG